MKCLNTYIANNWIKKLHTETNFIPAKIFKISLYFQLWLRLKPDMCDVSIIWHLKYSLWPRLYSYHESQFHRLGHFCLGERPKYAENNSFQLSLGTFPWQLGMVRIEKPTLPTGSKDSSEFRTVITTLLSCLVEVFPDKTRYGDISQFIDSPLSLSFRMPRKVFHCR